MIDFIRALVRPYIIYSGWGVLLGLLVYLVVKFAGPDDAKMLLAFCTGVVGTVIGYYVRDRVTNRDENQGPRGDNNST